MPLVQSPLPTGPSLAPVFANTQTATQFERILGSIQSLVIFAFPRMNQCEQCATMPIGVRTDLKQYQNLRRMWHPAPALADAPMEYLCVECGTSWLHHREKGWQPPSHW